MAEHDYVIANQNGANTRSDLNNALAAIVSNNSKATAPTTTYAYMWWADTANDILKQRNGADSAWISILTLSTGAPLATIANFTSTGIDDNATSTKLTISDTTITGVGAFTSTSIDATKLSGALPAIDGSALTGVGGGKVLQVVNATYDTETGSSSNTYIDTGITATITPSSASSTILVTVHQNGVDKRGSNTYIGIKLFRDATQISVLAAVAAATGTTAINNIGTVSTEHLDSPATTSAVVYKTQFRSGANAAVAYMQKDSAVSSITLTEIGA